MEESADEFGLWASGRRKCNWMYCLLRLRKRQDLYHYIRSLVFGGPDKLVCAHISQPQGAASKANHVSCCLASLQLVHVELTDATMPVALCICQEKMSKSMTAIYEDLVCTRPVAMVTKRVRCR